MQPFASTPLASAEANRALYDSQAGELDLFAFFLLLHVHRARIIACALVALLSMGAYLLAVKPRFSASASMIIPQKNPSAAGLALQAAGLDLVGGGNEVYTDILKSRIIADRLIVQYNLQQHYKAKTLTNAEEVLAARTVTSATKEGLLQVKVDDEDPKMAADLANQYLAELDHENQLLAIGAAGQQRRYYEQEMVKEKNALADAEIALKQSEEKTGVLEPTLQVQAGIAATESTRAQLRARQVQLGALLQSETPENADVIRLRGEIASIETQLQALQSQGGLAAGTPSTKTPAKVLDYVRDLREVKYHEALFEMLSREYASAKEQEAKNVSMIEILDDAVPADHKSWPPRTLYLLAAILCGTIAGVAYTLAKEIVATVIWNPENQARYRSAAHAAGRADRVGHPSI